MGEHRGSAPGFVRRRQWMALQSPSREIESQTSDVIEGLVSRLEMEREFEGTRAKTNCLCGRSVRVEVEVKVRVKTPTDNSNLITYDTLDRCQKTSYVFAAI